VFNQVFRTLLHSRLQYGLRQYQDDPNFRGDILVIEPKETDAHFFQLSAMSYWQRMRAAQYGYVSVTESIQQNYELIKQILESYGILMTAAKCAPASSGCARRTVRRPQRSSPTTCRAAI